MEVKLAASDSDSSDTTELDNQFTEKELVDYMKKVKLQKGYKMNQHELVLPMTVAEVWENFFADDAMFSMEESYSDIGDKLKSMSKWGPSDTDKIGSYDVIQMQTIKSKSKVPDTHDRMDVVKTCYLLQKSETELIIYVKMDSSNYVYAESFRTHMYWEVY